MTERVRRLLDDAKSLTPDERAELAEELLALIDGEPDPTVEAAWIVEIERRARRALSSESVGMDWSVVRERLQGKLDQS
jgi:hypothetical protein